MLNPVAESFTPKWATPPVVPTTGGANPLGDIHLTPAGGDPVIKNTHHQSNKGGRFRKGSNTASRHQDPVATASSKAARTGNATRGGHPGTPPMRRQNTATPPSAAPPKIVYSADEMRDLKGVAFGIVKTTGWTSVGGHDYIPLSIAPVIQKAILKQKERNEEHAAKLDELARLQKKIGEAVAKKESEDATSKPQQAEATPKPTFSWVAAASGSKKPVPATPPTATVPSSSSSIEAAVNKPTSSPQQQAQRKESFKSPPPMSSSQHHAKAATVVMALFDEFLDLALAKTVMGGMLPAVVESERRRRIETVGRADLTPMGTPEGGPRGTLSPFQLASAGAEGLTAIQDLPVAQHPLQPLLDGLNTPAEVVTAIRHKAHKVVGGPFLAQSGDTVQGLLQIELTFRFKRTNMRLQHIAHNHPNIVRLVQEYLCGEGFHIRCPPITDHILWKSLLERLRFDWIRDNKTRIFTELSKQWKKINTPFEQFCHFFFFRTARPAHECKGMLTHAQKPVIVATLTGDVDAVVQLADLGFFVPPDYYWQLLSFMVSGAIGAGYIDGPTLYAMRQVLAFLYERQEERVRAGTMQPTFNPLSPGTAVQPEQRKEQVELGTAPLPGSSALPGAKGVWGGGKAPATLRGDKRPPASKTSAPPTPQQRPSKDDAAPAASSPAKTTPPTSTAKKVPSKSEISTPAAATTNQAKDAAPIVLPLPKATGPRDPSNPWGRK